MKNNLRYAFGLVVLVVTMGIFWWLVKPAREALNQSAAVQPPAKLNANPPPAAAPKLPPVAPPVVPPASVAAPGQGSAAAIPKSETADPRLALGTALPDFIRLVDAGDYIAATEAYLQLPPEISAQQFVAALQQNPDFPQTVRMMLNTMRAAQEVTPTYNDAGDRATYTLSPAVDGKTSIRWKKVEDKWMLDAIEN